MTLNIKHRLSWRLRVLMAERNIATATELQRRLEKAGFNLTSTQVSRIIQKRPDRVSTDLLDCLLEVLNCDIGELLHREPMEAEGGQPEAVEPAGGAAEAKPKKSRVRRQPVPPAATEDLTGPKVTPFPIPPKK